MFGAQVDNDVSDPFAKITFQPADSSAFGGGAKLDSKEIGRTPVVYDDLAPIWDAPHTLEARSPFI